MQNLFLVGVKGYHFVDCTGWAFRGGSPTRVFSVKSDEIKLRIRIAGEYRIGRPLIAKVREYLPNKQNSSMLPGSAKPVLGGE